MSRSRVVRRTGTTPPREAPLKISGLAAWFDSRTDRYLTFGSGSAVSAWTSRAGSLGSVSFSQGTATNQPTRATGVATLGNQQALLFDGTNDFMNTPTASQWTFMHDNTGASYFVVERFDASGVGNMSVLQSCAGANSEVGIYDLFGTTSVVSRVCNGGASYQNNGTSNNSTFYARDASRWRVWSYGSGARTNYLSGVSLSNNDTGGQSPSSSAPTFSLRLGAANTAYLKGWIAQVLIFNKVLSAAERAQLAAWANGIYGVSV